MTSRERWTAVLAGAAAGFAGGLFGVGGGIVLVPILTSAFHFTQHRAHGTSLAVILFTALTAGVVYLAHGNMDWRTGAIVGLASIAGAPLGARAAMRLSNRGLKRAFSAFLILVALKLFWTPAGTAARVTNDVYGAAIDVGIGLVAGFFAGLMGVGGGFIAVPMFRLVFGMTQQLAQGTSLLVVLGAAASGARSHAKRGNVVMPLVPWLAIGAAIAGPLGSWWVQRLPQQLLTRAFAVFLIVNGVYGWVRVPKPAPKPTPTPAG